MELKYLFFAVFTDGTRFFQNAIDQSAIDPKKSSYYDLLVQVRSGKRIKRFFLKSQTEQHSVDLEDGSFVLNGTRVNPQPTSAPIPPGGEYELIYFRDRTETINVGTRERTQDTKFRFGWKYTFPDGKYLLQTVVLD